MLCLIKEKQKLVDEEESIVKEIQSLKLSNYVKLKKNDSFFKKCTLIH